MLVKCTIAAIAWIATTTFAAAQQPGQVELKIDSTNRTITVSTQGRVEADADVAILHIGFETRPSDAKSAYADGARISNAIVDAIRQAGIPETSIHSESQLLEPVDVKNHKFKLTQNWTVKTPSARAGEILDVAVNAGATDSGQIEWTVEDVHALEDRALEQAVTRAREDAEVMAKASGVHLGSLLYLTNRMGEAGIGMHMEAMEEGDAAQSPRMFGGTVVSSPLAIEPHQVVREAAVYAVFAIQ